MLFSVIKSETEPDTLANISLECICKNLPDIFHQDEFGFCLDPGMVLPKEICESLVEVYQRTGCSINDKFANLFDNKRRTSLQKVTIWNSSITNEGLKKILQYNLRELDLAYCKNLTFTSFDLINEYGKNMKSLSLGNEVKILNLTSNSNENDWKNKLLSYITRGYVFNTPNLTHLVLKNVRRKLESSFYETLLVSLPNLTHLNLSCCNDLGNFSYIKNCPNLISLILFNCANLEKAIPHICKLTKLK